MKKSFLQKKLVKHHSFNELKQLKSNDFIRFVDQQNQTQWGFHKIDPIHASDATIQPGNQVTFGFPKTSQIIYPNQTVRLNTGWACQAMPDGSMMHSVPATSLLDQNLITYPAVADPSQSGQIISQTILNNNKTPIKLQTVDGVTKMFKFNESLLLFEQIEDFDFGNFVTTLLGVGAQVIPLLL